MSTEFTFSASVPEMLSGKRLDQALAIMCPEHSRSRIASWIKEGYVTLNNLSCDQPKSKVASGDIVHISAYISDAISMEPEAISLNIVYEDEAVFVINKQAGMVVHPAAGNPSGTMLNALLHHCPELIKIPRAGIVHRLDKGTTGLMMVAKTLQAHTSLVSQLQARSVKRVYNAIVSGQPKRQMGTIDAPIGRDPYNRIKMAVLHSPEAKVAITHYKVLEPLTSAALVECKLETGRTHQIRVHMAYLGHPLIADETYTGRQRYPGGLDKLQRSSIDEFARPALHAKQLTFVHPSTNASMTFESEYPDDFSKLLTSLKFNTLES